MIVYSYFLVNGICKDDSSITGLEMINARNKLKVYKGNKHPHSAQKPELVNI